MAVKNLHLEHLEDEIINNGIDGGRASINFVRSLRDMMKGNSKSAVSLSQRNHYSIKNHFSTHQNQKLRTHRSYLVI